MNKGCGGYVKAADMFACGSQHRDKRTARWSWVLARIGVALVVITVPSIQESFADFTVQGAKYGWTMNVPDGWFGGNFYELERAVRSLRDEHLKNILKQMQETIKNKKLEALLLHSEDVRGSERVTSGLYINFVGESAEDKFADEEKRRGMWLLYGEEVIRKGMPGSIVMKIKEYSGTKVGGFPSYEAWYVVAPPQGRRI